MAQHSSTEQSTPVIDKAEINDMKADLEEFGKLFDEMDARNNMLVTEITSLKNIVIQLQSYTMSVNKQLLEQKQFITSADKPDGIAMNTLYVSDDEHA